MDDVKKTMRIGMMGRNYPVPENIAFEDKAVWLVEKSAELGCDCLHAAGNVMSDDENIVKRFAEACEKYDMELDVTAPYLFGLTGPKKDECKKAILDRISSMKVLNAKIMRGGYGGLRLATSRFNKDYPAIEQMKFIVENLKEVAKIAEDNGIYVAIENHCDFKGSEMAEIFDAVNSPYVGCALDTANGYTVFCDPDDDVQILSRYAVTTHIKDMVIKQEHVKYRPPFYAAGCPVGEGNVNVPAAIDLLAKESPHAKGLHLIIETGWIDYDLDWDQTQKNAYLHDLFVKSIAYIRSLL